MVSEATQQRQRDQARQSEEEVVEQGMVRSMSRSTWSLAIRKRAQYGSRKHSMTALANVDSDSERDVFCLMLLDENFCNPWCIISFLTSLKTNKEAS